MPIRELLQGGFNEAVNSTGDEPPKEAYVRLMGMLAGMHVDYDTYAQATITSGGHARNPSLSWIEIVKKNVASAQQMAEELFKNGQLDPMRTIEASTLGLINHWKESDYIEFWLYTLARVKTTGDGAAHNIDSFDKRFQDELKSHQLDLDVFNNYKKGAPERAPLYFKLADAFYEALEWAEYDPVRRLVAVSEVAGSLGASTERYFAKCIGAAAFNLAVAQVGGDKLPSNYPNGHLVADTATVVEYGGMVFDPRSGTHIVLVRDLG